MGADRGTELQGLFRLSAPETATKARPRLSRRGMHSSQLTVLTCSRFTHCGRVGPSARLAPPPSSAPPRSRPASNSLPLSRRRGARTSVSVLQQRLVREGTPAPRCPQTPAGGLIAWPGWSGINKLSLCCEGDGSLGGWVLNPPGRTGVFGGRDTWRCDWRVQRTGECCWRVRPLLHRHPFSTFNSASSSAHPPPSHHLPLP